MSIVFYHAPMSSATPVAWAFDELGVRHERVEMSFAAGDTRKPEFLEINPNGKVPTVVVDGTPLFEALAIMTWLGDTYGVERGLWPRADAPARLVASSWTTWAYVSFGAALNRLAYATSPRLDASVHSEPQAKLARDELEQLLAALDGKLSGSAYLLGDDFSLADLIVAGVVWYGTMVGQAVAGYANVARWLDACLERPAIKPTVKPG